MDGGGWIHVRGWGVYVRLHLAYSHTNPIRQDPVGQLTLVLNLAMPVSQWPFP